MIQHKRSRSVRRIAWAGSALFAAAFLVATVPHADAASVLVTKASADAYVRSDQPSANFGTKYVLDAQASSATTPVQLSYVRFTVSGLTKPIVGVKLRLYTYSTSNTGLQVWTAANNWTESAITYDTAPTPSTTMAAAIPTIATDTWAAADVGKVVTGNGTYTFVISTTSTANKQLASRESSASAPQLEFQISGDPTTVTATAGSGQATSPGTAFDTPLAATVADGDGVGVPNTQVTFTAPSSGASGAFGGGSQAVSVTTDGTGVATAPSFTANAQSGTYEVTAAAAGLTSAASFALTNSGTTTTTSDPPASSSAIPSSSAPPSSSDPPSSSNASSSNASSSNASSSNASSSTASPSPTDTAPADTTTSFKLSADSYVRSDQPDINFGAKYNLASEAASASTPTITSYVTVKVSGLTGAVTSANLQLYSYATSSLGVKVWNTSSNWTEPALTYTNAPSLGTLAGNGPNIMLNTWASVDLGSSITGNGTYSFAITTTRTANNQFGSRESGSPPKVVVSTSAAMPTPTSTPTPTPTSSSATATPTTSSSSSTISSAPSVTLVPSGGAVQSASVNTAFAAPLAVVAKDSAGTAVSGLAVSFQAPQSGASAAFPGGATSITVTTDSTGVATTPQVTANATTGTYAVTASTPNASQSASFTLTNADVTIVAAGDIACTQGDKPTATACQQVATSDLAMSLHPNAVLPLGDDQYELGSLADYQAMYDPSWGRLNAISYPAPGNHEYGYIGSSVQPTGGAGYFTYFGDRSHPLQPGCTSLCKSWYSYDIGSWHLISLDSQCAVIGGCNPGNPEYNWLLADLNSHSATKCTLAYWHIPLFSSSQDHQPDMVSMYRLLDSKGADVVLTGHAHFYERFAPQDSTGAANPNSIRQFVVGSGGRSFFPIRATPSANSEARIANTFGVLQMSLSSNSYSWQFVAANGGTASDSGSATCH